MANYYVKVTIGSSGFDDKKLKVTLNDTSPNFLENKVFSDTNAITVTTLNPTANATLRLNLVENQIDHNALLNYQANQHRTQDDTVTSTTTLWSSQKTQDELNTKVNLVTSTDKAIARFNGTSGQIQNSGVILNDTNDITGVNDLTMAGDLTVAGNLVVNGTTTTINTATLSVEDANITVNKGGNQSSANTNTAGLTVEMSDATDAVIGYDSSLTSKFKAGEVGDAREIVTTTHTQTLQNKTISADLNTITDIETSDLKSGVLSTDLSLTVTHTNLASALAIKNYALAITDFPSSFDTRLATKTTSDLAEGTNLYFTDERAQDAVGNALIDSSSIDFTYNDAADTITASVIPSGVDHDALLNFVANKHIDHSSVSINAGIGLSGGGDITASRTLSLDIPSLTSTTSISPANDDLVIYSASASAHRKIKIEEITNFNSSSGDINETSFTINQSQTNQPITGLSFANTVVRSFKAEVSVEIDATNNLFEKFTLEGIQIDNDWLMSIESTGDDSLIEFDITTAGQVTYSTPSYSGFVSGAVKFRAITTSI